MTKNVEERSKNRDKRIKGTLEDISGSGEKEKDVGNETSGDISFPFVTEATSC